MAETKSTILIPDISGFTEFMTTTELSHASHALNFLIDAIIDAVGEQYEVAEIEGDAVLLIRKGPPPTRLEMRDTCLRIFNAFHYQRKWMQQHTICPCGACQAIINLTLKFVAHHGPLSEIRVGRFIKPAGTEMIIAHRLLKNSINNNEYVLISEKLFEAMADDSLDVELDWIRSSEEYPALGKVEYRFALLNSARENVPDPPRIEDDYRRDDTSHFQTIINGNYFDVYLTASNIPGREKWMPGLRRVQQDNPNVFIGSVHHCTFDDYEAIISPLRMTATLEGVMFVEKYSIPSMGLSLVCELVYKKMEENTCWFSGRFMNTVDAPVPPDMHARLFRQLERMTDALNSMFEKHENLQYQY